MGNWYLTGIFVFCLIFLKMAGGVMYIQTRNFIDMQSLSSLKVTITILKELQLTTVA